MPADAFASALGTTRGLTVTQRSGMSLTALQVRHLRLLRDHGTVLTRRPDAEFDALVELGLAQPSKDYGGRAYRLTLDGYELTGRREGHGKSWTVVGGTLGDEGAWPRDGLYGAGS